MRKKNTHTRTENKWQSITIFTSNWNEFLYTGYDQSSSVTAGMIEWVFLGSLDSILVSKCVLDATSLEYMLRCQYPDRSVIDNGSLLSTLHHLLNSTLVWSLAVGFQSAFDAGAFRESVPHRGWKTNPNWDLNFKDVISRTPNTIIVIIAQAQWSDFLNAVYLFYFISFHFISFHFILYHFISFYFILLNFILKAW